MGEVAPGPESDRTGFVLLAGPGQARWMRVLPAAVRRRNRVLGPAVPFPCCHYPLGYSYSCSLGDLAVPHSEFSELEEVQARAKSSAELTTVGSLQDRGSARGGRAVRTACRCLCATVNLISGGRSRSWEVFEKGSEVTKAVLEALLAGPGVSR